MNMAVCTTPTPTVAAISFAEEEDDDEPPSFWSLIAALQGRPK